MPIFTTACHRTIFAALSIFFALASQPAAAADSSCKAVAKAGEAALAQVRMQQTVYAPASIARPPASASDLMHFIVIDKTSHTSVFKGFFEAKTMTSPDDKKLGAFYAVLLTALDENCRALGKGTLGGRSALLFEQGSNKKQDDVLFKIWIDAASGLPLRADLDEADVESKTTKGKDGKPLIAAQKNDKRQVNSVVFLFGDAVKAPTYGQKKGLSGTAATLDPQATASLLSLLN